jgi:vacuolar-type H+-ATPase subunit H
VKNNKTKMDANQAEMKIYKEMLPKMEAKTGTTLKEMKKEIRGSKEEIIAEIRSGMKR